VKSTAKVLQTEVLHDIVCHTNERAAVTSWLYRRSENIKVNVGTVYYISEEFLDLVQEFGIKSKTLGGQTYPAYCCHKDKTTSLIWMIPMSKNTKKFSAVRSKEIAKYGECLSVVIGKYDMQEVAFQVQGAFPVQKKHILYTHTRQRKKVSVEQNLKDEIRHCFDKICDLDERGLARFLHDNKRIEELLLSGEYGQSESIS
jgi:hypothetical protein